MVTSDPITDFNKVLRRIGLTAEDKKRVRTMLFGATRVDYKHCARGSVRALSPKAVKAKSKKRARAEVRRVNRNTAR